MKNFILLIALMLFALSANSTTRFFDTWTSDGTNQDLLLMPTGTGVVKTASGAELRLQNASGNYVGLKSDGASPSQTYTLPIIDGSAGDKMTTDGGGGLSFSPGTDYTASTGMLDGGVLTVGAPTSTFSISDGFGYVIDNVTMPGAPIITRVTFAGLTNIALDNIAGNFTEVGINSVGAVIQKVDSGFTNEERRDHIVLGRLVHTDHAAIANAATIMQISYDEGLDLQDLSNAIGLIKVSGGVVSANGANLNLDLSTGDFFSIGENYSNNKKNPNLLATNAAAAATWFYNYRDGGGGNTIVPSQTSVVPNFYDNGSGSLVSVSSNKWTIQRVYYFPTSENIIIHYGQNIYNNLAAAGDGVTTASFTPDPDLKTGILLAYILVKGNASDLSNSSQADFLQAGKLGEGSAGGTGSTTTNMQSVYENSTQPQIVLNSTQNGVEYQDASTPLGASLFSIQSNGGGTNYLDVLASGVTIDPLLNVDNLTLDGNTLSSTSGDIVLAATGEINTADNFNLLTEGEIRFQDASGGEYIGFKAPSVASGPTTFTLPIGDGAASQVLSTDGNAVLSWITAGSGSSTLSIVNKTTTYTALTSDDVITVDTSTPWTLTLYAASGNAGKVLTIIKTTADFESLTIDAAAAETINGNLTTSVDTSGEKLVLLCDGTNWIIKSRNADTAWASTTITINAVTTPPTKGTVVYDEGMWRRVGDSMEIQWAYRQTTAGTAGTGTYLVLIPESRSIDTAKMATFGVYDSPVVGSCQFGAADILGVSTVYDANNISLHGLSDLVNAAPWSSSFNGMSNANMRASFRAVVPIENWKGSDE